MKKSKWFIITFLFIWGALFTAGGLLVGGKTLFYNKTIGKIERITEDETCYTYKVGRERYNKCDSVYSDSYKVGKSIDIYYDKNNPENSTVGISKILFFIFSGLGIGAIIASIIILIKPSSKKKLLENGIPVNATVISIEINEKIAVNGIHPTVIKAKGFYDNDEKIFKSQNIYGDIPLISEGDNVVVYIDPNKSNKYYMDIEKNK